MGPVGRRLAGLAAAGSAGALAAAFFFQHVMQLAPCVLCIWQRWPHAAAVLLGLGAAAFGWRALAALGAVAALGTAGLGVYHVGVEQGRFEGPTACAGRPVGALSVEELLAQIMAAPIVRCDEVAWSLMGVSMPGWNAILSLGVAGLFAAAYASSSASQYR